MKKLFTFSLLLLTGLFLYSCSTSCKVPPKDAQGNPTVIQYPDK
jgi:PBP1b-binding outer membrane lipoprotein LpoB